MAFSNSTVQVAYAPCDLPCRLPTVKSWMGAFLLHGSTPCDSDHRTGGDIAARRGVGHREFPLVLPAQDGLYRSRPLEAVPGVEAFCVVIAFRHPEVHLAVAVFVCPPQ